MNIKKALISAVILYALIFLWASILMFVAKMTGDAFSVAMLVSGALLTFIVAKYYYFKSMKIVKPINEGLMLGVVFAVVTFVIEVPVMVYGFASTQGWNYFTSWSIMLSYLLALVVPIAAAYKKK
ncbi:MAG: hypothetical protein V1900_04690 [Candidatus Aenigmatarchaeota archaeon]